ncbi:IclR family transcriptional regulator [Cupriavidus sp. PET2-C1]
MTTNQSLARGLEILSAVDESGEPLGIRELARILDISPSIAQRLANTLVDAGYLHQVTESRKYRLGYRALALGSATARSDALHITASAELKVLAEAHQLNGYLGAIQQNSVVYLHTVQSSGPIAIRAEAGQRIAAHTTAMGKCLVAELSAERASLVLGPSPYAARTKHSITGARALQSEFDNIRKRGYAIADEENEVGVVSIGTVIRNKDGIAVAAISVAFLKAQRDAEEWPAIAQLVVSAALRCSKALGYSSNTFDQSTAVDRSFEAAK